MQMVLIIKYGKVDADVRAANRSKILFLVREEFLMNVLG